MLVHFNERKHTTRYTAVISCSSLAAVEKREELLTLLDYCLFILFHRGPLTKTAIII